jgi:hypothetical protein
MPPLSVSSQLIEFYRGAGDIKLRGGLDERSFVIEVSGRKEIRILVSILDPSYESVQEFVESLIDSYRRAGIGFDRLDLWVPKNLYAIANREVEEGRAKGDSWASKVTVRSLDRSFALDLEMKSASKEEEDLKVPRRSRALRSDRVVQDVDMRKLVHEIGKGLAEEISKNLETFIKEILSSDIKKEDPELRNRIHELERRIELLESFIKILGSYGTVPSLPKLSVQDLREPLVESSPKQKPKVERVEEPIIPKIEGSPPDVRLEASSTEDVLSEIFNNPWVSILRRKGEELESESD